MFHLPYGKARVNVIFLLASAADDENQDLETEKEEELKLVEVCGGNEINMDERSSTRIEKLMSDAEALDAGIKVIPGVSNNEDLNENSGSSGKEQTKYVSILKLVTGNAYSVPRIQVVELAKTPSVLAGSTAGQALQTSDVRELEAAGPCIDQGCYSEAQIDCSQNIDANFVHEVMTYGQSSPQQSW